MCASIHHITECVSSDTASGSVSSGRAAGECLVGDVDVWKDVDVGDEVAPASSDCLSVVTESRYFAHHGGHPSGQGHASRLSGRAGSTLPRLLDRYAGSVRPSGFACRVLGRAQRCQVVTRAEPRPARRG